MLIALYLLEPGGSMKTSMWSINTPTNQIENMPSVFVSCSHIVRTVPIQFSKWTYVSPLLNLDSTAIFVEISKISNASSWVNYRQKLVVNSSTAVLRTVPIEIPERRCRSASISGSLVTSTTESLKIHHIVHHIIGYDGKKTGLIQSTTVLGFERLPNYFYLSEKAQKSTSRFAKKWNSYLIIQVNHTASISSKPCT